MHKKRADLGNGRATRFQPCLWVLRPLRRRRGRRPARQRHRPAQGWPPLPRVHPLTESEGCRRRRRRTPVRRLRRRLSLLGEEVLLLLQRRRGTFPSLGRYPWDPPAAAASDRILRKRPPHHRTQQLLVQNTLTVTFPSPFMGSTKAPGVLVRTVIWAWLLFDKRSLIS